ncbi:MAG: YdcF family protein [Candidatus Sericytochromatia bacterium]|nr:YdcF family protein [Candidatus Sericytochromatia bacterium]
MRFAVLWSRRRGESVGMGREMGPRVTTGARHFRWLLRALLLLLLAPLVLTAWGLWLRPISPLGPVDAIFVPNGDPDFARTRYAASLFKLGIGHWFIVSGRGAGGDSAPLMAAEAQRFGVPATRILIEPMATTTAKIARLSAPLIEQHAVRRVLIVSSPLHLRRMGMAARKKWPGVTVLTVADDEPFDPWWWQDAAQWPAVWRESLKLIGYTLRGDML